MPNESMEMICIHIDQSIVGHIQQLKHAWSNKTAHWMVTCSSVQKLQSCIGFHPEFSLSIILLFLSFDSLQRKTKKRHFIVQDSVTKDLGKIILNVHNHVPVCKKTIFEFWTYDIGS